MNNKISLFIISLAFISCSTESEFVFQAKELEFKKSTIPTNQRKRIEVCGYKSHYNDLINELSFLMEKNKKIVGFKNVTIKRNLIKCNEVFYEEILFEGN